MLPRRRPAHRHRARPHSSRELLPVRLVTVLPTPSRERTVAQDVVRIGFTQGLRSSGHPRRRDRNTRRHIWPSPGLGARAHPLRTPYQPLGTSLHTTRRLDRSVPALGPHSRLQHRRPPLDLALRADRMPPHGRTGDRCDEKQEPGRHRVSPTGGAARQHSAATCVRGPCGTTVLRQRMGVEAVDDAERLVLHPARTEVAGFWRLRRPSTAGWRQRCTSPDPGRRRWRSTPLQPPGTCRCPRW